ncbi:MAG: hypothetical protein JO202_08385 [Ktedonobacteraceae bacterium]|nr:hypothetical protein [Ktedonobacteraceae bacterium]
MTIQTNKIVLQSSFPAPGRYLCGVAWDGKYLWHSDADLQAIFAFDKRTGNQVQRYSCPNVRTCLSFDGTLLWQVVDMPKKLCGIDPQTGQITGHKDVLPETDRLCGIEYDVDGLWMGLNYPSRIQLRSKDAQQIIREIPIEGDVAGLTVGPGGEIVYTNFLDSFVRVIDRNTGAGIKTAETIGQPTGITWDGEVFWYCDWLGHAIRSFKLDW